MKYNVKIYDTYNRLTHTHTHSITESHMHTHLIQPKSILRGRFEVEADRYHFLKPIPIFEVKYLPILSVADITGHLLSL